MSWGRSILRRIGPGFIMASVVLGPGSIVAASRAGAEAGYRLLWVLVSAAVLMAVYTSMGARLGCALDTTPLDYLSRKTGRWLAALAGVSGFLVAAGFQFGNNLGVAFALGGLLGEHAWLPLWLWPILFTGLSMAFLWSAKHVYKALERMMMVLVAVMIVAFVANLFWTGISVPRLVGGLVPRGEPGDLIIASAMLATTFSVVGAFYQAYLVRAKGWKREDLKTAVSDAWLGISALGIMSAVIMIGSAETLFGSGSSFGHIGQLAQQLRGILGPVSNLVFCCGLAAASFSSFIVNAIVGGGLLADGFGLDSQVDSKSTRWCASAALLAGCLVAIVTLVFGTGTTQTTSLLIAQASTLLAVPLCALLLLVLTSSRSVMGDLRNRAVTMALGGVGLAILLWLAWTRLSALYTRVADWFQ
ncbi:MAG: Nramp family divalent metal transporter [Candidatus Hydrogenedentes bacterium]|nr:Nramp family divalent metal transporter [Candidatus Hydrogenedentota bacterium]